MLNCTQFSTYFPLRKACNGANGSRDSSVITVTKIQDGKPTDHGKTQSTEKDNFFSLKCKSEQKTK